MAKLIVFPLVLLLIINLSQATLSNNQTLNGFSFRMFHHDSLNSPLYQSKISFEEKIERLFNSSKARLDSLKRVSRTNSSLNREIKVVRPAVHNKMPGSFLVQVGIGTFGSSQSYKTYYLLLDTASDDTWTQCEGCNPCFRQKDPNFPWSQSQTYRMLPCDECPPGTRCDEEGHGILKNTYADKSKISGIRASETFTFETNNVGSLQTIPNFHFGCVFRSKGFNVRDPENINSGIFGMSRGPTSFISQVGAHFRRRFSHCFTHVEGEESTMFLRFGDDIPPLSRWRRQRTPLLTGHHPVYYLDLQGISVGSTRLNIDPSVFQQRQDFSGGFLIDSGATNSFLNIVAYQVFEQEIMRRIEGKNRGMTLIKREPVLCYRQTRPRGSVKFPTVTFHLANKANFVVQPTEYISSAPLVPGIMDHCVLFSKSDGESILGAYQQVNHRIIYDVEGSELQFAPTNCFSSN